MQTCFRSTLTTYGGFLRNEWSLGDCKPQRRNLFLYFKEIILIKRMMQADRLTFKFMQMGYEHAMRVINKCTDLENMQ